jgi:hypothetical protein
MDKAAVGISEMSTYHHIWAAYQQQQQQISVSLALIGLGLAAGWLMIGRVVPARWQPAVRWVYVIAAGLVELSLFIMVRG